MLVLKRHARYQQQVAGGPCDPVEDRHDIRLGIADLNQNEGLRRARREAGIQHVTAVVERHARIETRERACTADGLNAPHDAGAWNEPAEVLAKGPLEQSIATGIARHLNLADANLASCFTSGVVEYRLGEQHKAVVDDREVLIGGGLGGIVILIIALLLGADPRQLLEQMPSEGPAPTAETSRPTNPEEEEQRKFVGLSAGGSRQI